MWFIRGVAVFCGCTLCVVFGFGGLSLDTVQCKVESLLLAALLSAM